MGGPRHAGGLPSGRAEREQAELVLRKGREKGGGGWPRNSRIRKLIRNSKVELEEEEYSSFSSGPHVKVFTTSLVNS